MKYNEAFLNCDSVFPRRVGLGLDNDISTGSGFVMNTLSTTTPLVLYLGFQCQLQITEPPQYLFG